MPTASEYRSGRPASRGSFAASASRPLYRTTTGNAATTGVRKGASRQSVGPHQEAPRHGCTGGGCEDDLRLPALPNLLTMHKRHGEEGLRTALDNFPLDIYIDGIDHLHAQVAKLQRQCNQMEFALVTWQSYMHAVMNYVEHHQSCDDVQFPNSEPAPPSTDFCNSATAAAFADFESTRAPPIDFPYKMASTGTTVTVPRLGAPMQQQSSSMLVRDVPPTDVLPSNLPGPMNSFSSSSIPPGLPRPPTSENRIPTGPLLPPLTLSVEERAASHSQPHPRPGGGSLLGGSFTQPNNPNRMQPRAAQREPSAHTAVENVAEMHLNAHIDSLRAMVDNHDLGESTFLSPGSSWNQGPQGDMGRVNAEGRSQSDESSSDNAENIAPRANAAVNKQYYKKSSSKSPSAAGKDTRPLLRKQHSMESNEDLRPTGAEIASAVESYRADLYRTSGISAQSNAPYATDTIVTTSKQREVAPPPDDLGTSFASSDSGYVFPTKVQMNKQQRPALVPSLALGRAESHKSAWLQGENTSGDFYAS